MAFISHRLNLSLLVASYFAGQGSLFFLQTFLIQSNDYQLAAELSICVFASTFAMMIIDFGGTSILAQRVAAIALVEVSVFRSVVFTRLAACAVTALAAAFSASSLTDYQMGFMVGASLGVSLWTLNTMGLLDGLRSSGHAGLSSALPFVAVATAALFAPKELSYQPGLYAGAAWSAGILAAVVYQGIIVLLRAVLADRARDHGLPYLELVVNMGSALLVQLPGQVYFRIQLALCSVFGGAFLTAIFVYAKQIVVGLVQLVQFIRRVEFPDLVLNLSKITSKSTISVAWNIQKFGTTTACILSVMMLCFGIFVSQIKSSPIHAAGPAIALFSVTVFTSAVSLASSQTLTAIGRYRLNALVALLSIFCASIILALTKQEISLFWLLLADLIVAAVTISVSSVVMAKFDHAR